MPERLSKVLLALGLILGARKGGGGEEREEGVEKEVGRGGGRCGGRAFALLDKAMDSSPRTGRKGKEGKRGRDSDKEGRKERKGLRCGSVVVTV